MIVPPPPSQVTEFIILGGLPELVDPLKLKTDFPNLEYVLCTAEECTHCKTPSQHFTETRVIIPDELTENNFPNEEIFSKAFEFMDMAKQSGKQIYVHCARGRSRSATIVLSYLMYMEHKSLRDAFLIVKRARNFIGPHGPLRVQLLHYERLLVSRGHYGTDAVVTIKDMLDWHNVEIEFKSPNAAVVQDEREQVEKKAKKMGLFDKIKSMFT
jgi:protein-tyrosine phosphatase